MQGTKERRITSYQIREEHFDRDRLKGMFLIKGKGSYLTPASEMLCTAEPNTSKKINEGRLSHEDTILLAKGLELTAKEYIEIFCAGVFTPKD